MKKLLAIFLMSYSATAFALLPPLYTSADQISGMLNSQALGKALDSGEVIMEIKRKDDGFDIITNKSRVHVIVKGKQEDKIGPGSWQYSFSIPEPVK